MTLGRSHLPVEKALATEQETTRGQASTYSPRPEGHHLERRSVATAAGLELNVGGRARPSCCGVNTNGRGGHSKTRNN